MRKLLVTSIAIAATATAGAAMAMDASGTVKKWDATTHMLTLENGISYTMPDRYKAGDFTTGEKVKVTYELKDGKHLATVASEDRAPKKNY